MCKLRLVRKNNQGIIKALRLIINLSKLSKEAFLWIKTDYNQWSIMLV